MTTQPELVSIQALADQLRAASTAPRRGTTTSEFKLTAIAFAAGMGLVALGSYSHDPVLRDEGLQLIQWAVAAYSVSRGISKIGPKTS